MFKLFKSTISTRKTIRYASFHLTFSNFVSTEFYMVYIVFEDGMYKKLCLKMQEIDLWGDKSTKMFWIRTPMQVPRKVVSFCLPFLWFHLPIRKFSCFGFPSTAKSCSQRSFTICHMLLFQLCFLCSNIISLN